MRTLPWTWGSQAAAPPPIQTAQWVWAQDAGQVRTFPPRVRDEYWVETGHIETTDPATDSREG